MIIPYTNIDFAEFFGDGASDDLHTHICDVCFYRLNDHQAVKHPKDQCDFLIAQGRMESQWRVDFIQFLLSKHGMLPSGFHIKELM